MINKCEFYSELHYNTVMREFGHTGAEMGPCFQMDALDHYGTDKLFSAQVDGFCAAIMELLHKHTLPLPTGSDRGYYACVKHGGDGLMSNCCDCSNIVDDVERESNDE